jgi:error-prone DNA polymerase
LGRRGEEQKATVAGLVIAHMTPRLKSGQRVLFLTLEDQKVLTDVVVFPDLQEKFGRAACFGAVLIVRGIVRRMSKRGIGVTAYNIIPLVGG